MSASKKLNLLVVTLTLAVLGSLAGCGTSGDHDGADVALTPRQALLQSIEHESDEASFHRPYATVAEMLPNTKHHVVGQPAPVVVFDAVVVGRITDVANGDGYIEATGPPVEGQVGGGPIKAPFDSPLANWRTLRLSVDVERRIAGDVADDFAVDWSLLGSSAKGDDAAAVTAGLLDLGTVVLFLDRSPAATAPSGLSLLDRVYGIGVVRSGGRLEFPFVEAERVTPFMNGVATIDDLVREAGKPDRVKGPSR